MRRYLMLALSRPVEGQEAEFNEWYEHKHLDQVLALPGFKTAQRFGLARKLVEGEAHPYLTVYEIETDDLDASLQAMVNKAGTTELEISVTLDTGSVHAVVYEALGAVRKAETE